MHEILLFKSQMAPHAAAADANPDANATAVFIFPGSARKCWMLARFRIRNQNDARMRHDNATAAQRGENNWPHTRRDLLIKRLGQPE